MAEDTIPTDPANLCRGAVDKARTASAEMDKVKQALEQIFAADPTAYVVASPGCVSPVSTSFPSSALPPRHSETTPETSARRNLGSICLLLETALRHGADAHKRFSQLLTPASVASPQPGLQITETDTWRALRRKISVDLTGEEDLKADLPATTVPPTDHSTVVVSAAFKWREVIYIIDDEDESRAPSTGNQASASPSLSDGQSPGSVASPELLLNADRSDSEGQSPAATASLPRSTTSRAARAAKRRSAGANQQQSGPAASRATRSKKSAQPARGAIGEGAFQRLLTRLEEAREQIEAAIRRDKGVPPTLQELAVELDAIEQQFAKERGYRGPLELQQLVGALMDRAQRVGENWGPYFRGRSYALLKMAKRLSSRAIEDFMHTHYNVKVSFSTVTASIAYYRFCLRFPALPWTSVPFTTVVEQGKRLAADQRFQDFMKGLAKVVREESGVGEAESEEGETDEEVEEEEEDASQSGEQPWRDASLQDIAEGDPLAMEAAVLSPVAWLQVDPPRLATVGDGVAVRYSTLPNAGRGLFATRPFPAGTMITGYEGRLISRDEALALREAGLDSHIARCGQFAFHSLCVDGVRAELLQPGMAGGSACNHKEAGGANATLVHFDAPFERVEVQAVRDVGEGEEIFLDYGRGYVWEGGEGVEV